MYYEAWWLWHNQSGLNRNHADSGFITSRYLTHLTIQELFSEYTFCGYRPSIDLTSYIPMFLPSFILIHVFDFFSLAVTQSFQWRNMGLWCQRLPKGKGPIHLHLVRTTASTRDLWWERVPMWCDFRIEVISILTGCDVLSKSSEEEGNVCAEG